jgi:hypothetical protein
MHTIMQLYEVYMCMYVQRPAWPVLSLNLHICMQHVCLCMPCPELHVSTWDFRMFTHWPCLCISFHVCMQSCITLPMCVCKKNSRSVSACTCRRMNNSAIAHHVTVRVQDNIVNVNSFVWTHTVAQTHSKTHRSCHNVHPCMHILCAGIVPMSGSEVKLLAGHCEPAVLLLWDSSAGSVCMHDKVSSVAACV